MIAMAVNLSVVFNKADIAASDGLMNLWRGSCTTTTGSTMTLKSDLDNFPDLQMYPAVAGAVVPIYNIPDIPSTSNLTLVLGRKTLKNIFMGNIQVSTEPRMSLSRLSSMLAFQC
jgi:hypothetical protein